MNFILRDVDIRCLMECNGIHDINNKEEYNKYARKIVAIEICKKIKEPCLEVVLLDLEKISIDNLDIVVSWINDEPINKQGVCLNISELFDNLHEEQIKSTHPFYLLVKVVEIFQEYENCIQNKKIEDVQKLKKDAIAAIQKINCIA